MSTHLPFFFFFFNDPTTTEIYTLSLHDALPICLRQQCRYFQGQSVVTFIARTVERSDQYQSDECIDHFVPLRSEEHTSELQSRFDLVCRLLLEKKKKTKKNFNNLFNSNNSTHIS